MTTTGAQPLQYLGDIAAHFPILPNQLADALDAHGIDTKAWAWIADGKLLRLEVVAD